MKYAVKNLGDLRDLTSWIVNFNEGQTDQDFAGPSTDANKHINRALNLCYSKELELAIQNCGVRAFMRRTSFTWPADATSLDIPWELRGKTIHRFKDNTSLSPGPTLAIWDDMVDGSGMFMKSVDKYGWYPAPSSDLTIRVIYIADANDLINDGDEPELLPLRNRELIAWSAAVWLRTVADEAPPQAWLMEREEQRQRWWKTLTMGYPQGIPPPRIRNDNPDVADIL